MNESYHVARLPAEPSPDVSALDGLQPDRPRSTQSLQSPQRTLLVGSVRLEDRPTRSPLR